jgi:hypothetical protein
MSGISFIPLICILQQSDENMHSNNFGGEKHGTKFEAIMRHFIKQINISLGYHFKHSNFIRI